MAFRSRFGHRSFDESVRLIFKHWRIAKKGHGFNSLSPCAICLKVYPARVSYTMGQTAYVRQTVYVRLTAFCLKLLKVLGGVCRHGSPVLRSRPHHPRQDVHELPGPGQLPVQWR